ncbi:type 1 glutamine amidotransferase domain-containing protein [Leucobacter sp. GX24907]
MTHLADKRVAILATDGFEDSELTSPLGALREHGATVAIVSTETGSIAGKNGHEAQVDITTSRADAGDYDALVLPGGVSNGDKIRLDDDAVAFTRAFFEQHKPVAAICHGGWILADADVLQGRTVTSYPSLRTDLRNAGAEWVDEEVVVDQGLVTSRTPDDLPAFNAKLIEEIAEGTHRGQTA